MRTTDVRQEDRGRLDDRRLGVYPVRHRVARAGAATSLPILTRDSIRDPSESLAHRVLMSEAF
jgi:hypothetical protein